MDLYKDADIYDLDYDARRFDIEFYLNEAKNKNGEVLELGSGTGRISTELYKHGVKLTCIDNSPEMIKKAFLKNSKLNIIEADFVNFNLNKKFDLIIMPFNSFLHLYSFKEAQTCLNSIKNHMNKNAKFIFDINNPDFFELERIPNEPVIYEVYKAYYKDNILKRYLGQKDIETLDVIVEDTIDYELQIANYKLFYTVGGKQEFFKTLKHRIYFPQEIELMLNLFFKIESKFGNFDRSKFHKHSPSQIFICLHST